MVSNREEAKSQSSTRNWPCTVAAWAAGFAGILMIIGGGGHLIAIIAIAVKQQRPFDFHLISLIATGGILLYPGLLNLGISKWIGRGSPWAFAMSAFATASLLIYMVLLLFQNIPAENTDPFAGAKCSASKAILINGIYLVILLVAWIDLRRRKTV